MIPLSTNYELDKLDISVVDSGFIVGISMVGSVVGESSPFRIDVTDQLLSLSISLTREVEDDVYLVAKTPVLQMACKFEDTPAMMKGKTVIVQYNGQDELFRGQVIQSSRSVALDLGLSRQGFRRWTVSLTATPGDDRSVGYRIAAPDAPQNDPASAILERVPYLASVAVDLGLENSPDVAAGHEANVTAQELLRRVSRIMAAYVEIDPEKASRVLIRPYDYGATWTLRDDAFPSYSAVEFVERLDAATSVTVTPMFKPEGAVPDELSVTRSAPGAIRNDRNISVDVPWDLAALEEVASRLPVKSALPERIAAVQLPFSALLDTSVPPTRLILWLDGRRYDAAVIGVDHNITPRSWSIGLQCAPIHLLTRESDA